MSRVTDSSFRKVDLHVHTPRSMCYSDKSVTPQQIVDAAVAAGLEAIAVGYSLRFPDDHENLERQFDVYDALYAWCRLDVARKVDGDPTRSA